MARVTKDGVICYAHPITVGQYKRMEEKGLDAFKSAPLSDRALQEGAGFYNKTYGTGYCFTTSAMPDSSNAVRSILDDGSLYCDVSEADDAGLRVALHPIYNPQSKIVKTEKSQTRTAQIGNDKNSKTERKTSTGTVVTVGGIQYLWLNKNECENGNEKTMDLISTEIVACSVPFGREDKPNDYAEATDLQEQCEAVALEHCDEEELALLQEGLLSKEDNYENWTSLEVKKERPSSAKEVYQQIEAGKLTPEEGKQALKAILDEIKQSDGSAEEIQKFTQDLEAEHKAYLQRHAEGTKDAYDAANATIDALNFGGDEK